MTALIGALLNPLDVIDLGSSVWVDGRESTMELEVRSSWWILILRCVENDFQRLAQSIYQTFELYRPPSI